MYAISLLSATCASLHIRSASTAVATPRHKPEVYAERVRLPFLRTSLTIISEPRIYVLPSDRYVLQPKTAVLNIYGTPNPTQNIYGTPNPTQNLAVTTFADDNKRTFDIHKHSLVLALLISASQPFSQGFTPRKEQTNKMHKLILD